MKRVIITLVLIVGFLIPLFSSQEKLIFGKKYLKNTPQKKHPNTEYFSKQYKNYKADAKSPNFNKLLVILVDFQEDNDSNTTGNGKFISIADPNYQPSIDSPPHNKLFYETQMEALKYYYRAVSFENYQLEYDVYPKNTQAYTLPNNMAYYNPGPNSELFISRVEEYFHDIFTIADQDSNIVFANYGHYMVIHAGSDWQHDVKGDTPSDIPSFFIRVGTGKEVTVDNGATVISHTCNVPETITQDLSETSENGVTFVSGYGAVNAVYAHEFGHSLGLVDLYNVRSYRPEVGVFDIMDSGGQGIATFPDTSISDRYYSVEGALPVLPGAWSRNLIFRDIFLNKGITKSLSSKYVNYDEIVKIKAAETKFEDLNNTPYFYEIPLNNDEYIILENRNTDPDEDGGTTIKSALNQRVALYPSPYDSDDFTYEYDWMLPSWEGTDHYWYGGGILAWHIDNKRIFETGQTDSEGNFVSNFDNNTVNTLHTKRGVRIIEADDLPDIGNPDSWFWTGTAYEYFSKYKPTFNESGLFAGWNTSDTLSTGALSAFTKPALISNDNKPSTWSINNISIPGAIMTFKISNILFDKTQRLLNADSLLTISPICNFVSDTASDIMITTNTESQYFSHSYDNTNDDWNSFWTDEKLYRPSLPITKFDFKQNGRELMIIVENSLLTITNHEVRQELQFNENITDTPLAYMSTDLSNPYLIIPFANKIEIYSLNYNSGYFTFLLTETINISGKIALSNNTLIIQSINTLSLYNLSSKDLKSYSLKGSFSKYNPVACLNTQQNLLSVFIISDNGEIYSLKDAKLSKIFDTKEFTKSLPSQLGLSINSQNQLIIHLGAGNRVFEMYQDGSLLNNFPLFLENYSIKSYSEINVVFINDKTISIFNCENSGLIGVTDTAQIDEHFTMFWDKGNFEPIWFKENQSSRLYVLYTDSDNNVILSWKALSSTDAILWNGYRNNYNASISGNLIPLTNTNSLNAFVYPNPIQKSSGRIRIENPNGDISLKIYDISGNLIINEKLINNGQNVQDYQLNVSNFRSAVFIAFISDDKVTKRIKFSVLK